MKRDSTWCSHHKPRRHESQVSAKLLRHIKWYRRERARLIAALGGKCVDCGTTEELEFDELVARPPGMPRPNKTSRWQRLRNYIKMHKLDQICLRCRCCNAKKGSPPCNAEHDEQSSNPF